MSCCYGPVVPLVLTALLVQSYGVARPAIWSVMDATNGFVALTTNHCMSYRVQWLKAREFGLLYVHITFLKSSKKYLLHKIPRWLFLVNSGCVFLRYTHADLQKATGGRTAISGCITDINVNIFPSGNTTVQSCRQYPALINSSSLFWA